MREANPDHVGEMQPEVMEEGILGTDAVEDGPPCLSFDDEWVDVFNQLWANGASHQCLDSLATSLSTLLRAMKKSVLHTCRLQLGKL